MRQTDREGADQGAPVRGAVHQGRPGGVIASLTSVDPQRSRAAQTLFVAAFVAYGVDRLTKIWAEATLPGAPIEVIPNVLTLRFTENSGGAFSIGRSAPWFFVGVTAIVVA